jgi:hypothetical protein
VAALALVAGGAMAQLTWCGDSYMTVNTGSGVTWYNGSATFQTVNFHGASWTITEGGQFNLGGELQSWDSSGDSAKLNYKVNAGAFSGINLPFLTLVGANEEWQSIAGSNIGPGLPVGVNTLEVYFDTIDTDGAVTAYDSRGGPNYTATVTVNAIPEPSTMALIGLGVGGALLAIRRRK